MKIQKSKQYRGYRIKIRVQDSLLPWCDRYVRVSVYDGTARQKTFVVKCDTDVLSESVERVYEDARGFVDDRCEKQNHDRRAVERALEDDT